LIPPETRESRSWVGEVEIWERVGGSFDPEKMLEEG